MVTVLMDGCLAQVAIDFVVVEAAGSWETRFKQWENANRDVS
jgi:hypothetical protein